ncbi:MAG TPA: transposase [Armatimonadota bacterium]
MPTTWSWFLVGQRLKVPRVASEGQRLNVIGAYCSSGLEAGRFVFRTLAKLRKGRKPESAGLQAEEVGSLDSAFFLKFLWEAVAGRPQDAPEGWRRVRPVVVVLDNAPSHKSREVKAELLALSRAGVPLCYLPSYTPELSEIEPIWKTVKYHEMPRRSYPTLLDLRAAVERVLAAKARQLLATHQRSDNSLSLAA